MQASTRRFAFAVVALAISYVLAARLGLAFAVVAEQVTLVWPPTGLALGALIVFGRRLWPGVLAGAFVVNVWAHAPPVVALAIAAGNTTEALLGVWLLQRAGLSPGRWRVLDAIVLVASAMLVCAPLGATAGAASLCGGGLEPWSAFGPLWRDWWLGDAVGALVVAPVILCWRAEEARRHRSEAAALFAGAAVVSGLGFALLEPTIAFPVHYLGFPFVIWAALRFGPRSTGIVVLIVATIEVYGTIRGLGPFGGRDNEVRLIFMQVFVAMLATTGLVLAAVSGERQRLAAKLVARARSLEVRDRTRQEFLAMLGHELRNPLAPILQATELMKGDGTNEAGIDRLRGVIARQSRQLARLVDDLLDVSRISSGKIIVVRRPTDLSSVLDVATEASQPLFDAARVKLTTVRPAETLVVDGDPARLAQVVANLLNNAARYTPEGGHARLELAREGERAVIRVRDDGLGMSRDLLSAAFELFTQGPRTPNRAPGGLGIGLNLVREIVGMHGGAVEARSDGAGKGSVFTVRLPLLPAESRATAKPKPAPPPLPIAPTARRVLVVDDNVDAAEMLAKLLQIAGHEVRTAHDGPSALAAARADPPEVIVLDIGMPGMNGYELARAIRADTALADVRLVAVTGYGQAEDVAEARAAGFNRHLVKPVDPGVLRELVAAR